MSPLGEVGFIHVLVDAGPSVANERLTQAEQFLQLLRHRDEFAPERDYDAAGLDTPMMICV